jgi:hypothetical protein
MMDEIQAVISHYPIKHHIENHQESTLEQQGIPVPFQKVTPFS